MTTRFARRPASFPPVLLASALILSACAGSSNEFSGFESSEECLKAMPLVRPEIQVDALADRCGVSEGMAEIALQAASVVVTGPTAAQGGDGQQAQAVVTQSTDSESPDLADGDSAGPASSVLATPESTTTTPAPTTTTTTAAPTTTIVGGIEVPDVEGLDHQLAQDTMQFAGLRNLAEEDASGEGRRLLWDRNWIVVEQDPVAGTIVTKDTKITLHSLKDDEVGQQ